jgi:integrase
VGAALLFAIETGMRMGEIAALKWSDIDKTVANVRRGKTAAAARRVPLSPEALRLLKQLPKDNETCFGLLPKQIDALFRKARDKALINDLHFHDSRATAVGRLAKKLDILDLAKMIGHKDLRMLQVYYRDSAEDIAKRLAK